MSNETYVIEASPAVNVLEIGTTEANPFDAVTFADNSPAEVPSTACEAPVEIVTVQPVATDGGSGLEVVAPTTAEVPVAPKTKDSLTLKELRAAVMFDTCHRDKNVWTIRLSKAKAPDFTPEQLQEWVVNSFLHIVPVACGKIETGKVTKEVRTSDHVWFRFLSN
jgi:hypothetical protein